MAYEQRDNSGSLFKNDQKTGNQPDYKGNIRVDGVDYWLSAWVKESKSGTKFMSLSLNPKEKKSEKKEEQQSTPDDFDSFDDDTPF